MTVLQRKASMQQIGHPIVPAIKLDNENIGGHCTPLQRMSCVSQEKPGRKPCCLGVRILLESRNLQMLE